MAFNKLIAKGVKLARDITSSLQADVTHEPWIASGNNGQPLFGTAVTRKAIVGYDRRLIRNVQGEQVMQSASVLFLDLIASNGATGRREPVDPRDQITLPDGHTGPIVNIKGPVNPDTDAPYLLEIALG